MNIIKIKTLFVVFSFFSVVFVNAQPIGYYNGTEGKSGDGLKLALHEIISNHVDFSYNEAKYLINYSDADPANPNNVILFYSQISRDASKYGNVAGTINREHVWAKSHGNFSGIRPMDGDALNLRPADAIVNMNRSNLDFDNVQPNGTQDAIATDCWYNASAYEPGPLTKGQVARILFYMATRYEGTDGEMDLELVSKLNNYPEAKFGNLTTLLVWNKQYPPSAMERQRNERIFRMQQNRNPFVDHPEFADFIWNNETPAGPEFGNFVLSPEYPVVNSNATVSLTISNATDLTDVSIFWGNIYDSETHQLAMTNSGENYTADLSFTGYNAGDMIYFKVVTTNASNEKTTFRANYLLPENTQANELTSISDVQGTGNATPMASQQVTISGRVTANFDNSYYLQSGNGKRSGINIYNTLFTGKVGDSLVIKGTATEYSDLTEIGTPAYVYNFKANKTPEPVVITAAELNEDYEGMLVQINNVTFDKPGSVIQAQNTSYYATDNTATAVVYITYNSRLVNKSFPTKATNLVGVVSQYQGTYQILPRDINDFREYTSVAGDLQKTNPEVVVFPNPATDMLNIQSAKKIRSVRILNLAGQTVKEFYSEDAQISIQNLREGMYIVVATFNDNTTGKARFFKYN
ncbi:MAG: endonuclease [Prolixibacteraceae bacterium]|jgi:endonuclease I